MVFAYQYFWNKHIGTEFFLGLGAANIKREFYSTQVLSDGIGGTYQDVKYNDFNEFAEISDSELKLVLVTNQKHL